MDLLEKYWSGNTTLSDEQALRDYFSSENVAPEHEVYRNLFQSFEMEQMEEEGRIIQSWGGNSYIKIPITNTKGESTSFLIQKLTKLT